MGFAANFLIATLGVVFTTKALKQEIRNQQSSEGLFRRPSLPIGSKLQSMWQAPKLTFASTEKRRIDLRFAEPVGW